MNRYLRTPTRVKLIEVIQVVDVRGGGTDDDPVRSINQYWSKDGILLAEFDKHLDNLSPASRVYSGKTKEEMK